MMRGALSLPTTAPLPPPLAGEGWGEGRYGLRRGCFAVAAFFLLIAAALALDFPALSGRVDGLDGRLNTVNQATQAAQARADSAQGRADSAYKLAEGKFVMTEVGREQINFDTGKSALTNEAKATLTTLAERLKSENKNVYLEVRGHADVRGGKHANRQLGRERAANTSRFLVDQGVPGNKIQLGSWGEDQPKAAGKTAESHAENRRVEIVILG